MKIHKWSISGQIDAFVKIIHKEKEVYYPQIISIKFKLANCNGLFFCCLKLEMKHGYDSVLWEQQEPGSRIVENRKEKM